VNLTLEAVEVEGGPTVPIGAWDLFALTDPPRPVLSNNGAPRPSLRVPAGRYEVRVRAGTATLAERFDASGAQQVFRVVLNLGTLRPVAALVPGAPPLGGKGTIPADEVPGARAGETVTANGAAEPAIRLVQGSCRVRFQSGEARGEADMFVAAGRVLPLRLDLMAAELRLVATRGGAAVEGGLLWAVRRAGEARAVISGAQRARFVLPAGEWVARLRSAGQWIEPPRTLRAGESREVAAALP
jgi:hypothetical protein